MAVDFRPLAIATAGFTAFVNLYSPQALLPELSHEFGVGAGEISALITASSAAIALTAPFTGALADVIGRKRLITAAAFVIVIPTLMMAWAWTVPQLVVLRFVQGLLLPPIFTVAVAYVGDEWPPADVAASPGCLFPVRAWAVSAAVSPPARWPICLAGAHRSGRLR
jgi:YNFM family putative membrane transporter